MSELFKIDLPDGIQFIIEDRDISGNPTEQDKYSMLLKNGNQEMDLGSHPTLNGAKQFYKERIEGKSLKDIKKELKMSYLKFSSISEALQHLSDISKSRVLISKYTQLPSQKILTVETITTDKEKEAGLERINIEIDGKTYWDFNISDGKLKEFQEFLRQQMKKAEDKFRF